MQTSEKRWWFQHKHPLAKTLPAEPALQDAEAAKEILEAREEGLGPGFPSRDFSGGREGLGGSLQAGDAVGREGMPPALQPSRL